MSDIGFQPPHSAEAEQVVLGGLLLTNNAYDAIADVLREADFFSAQHRLIYRNIVAMIDAGETADVITVYERLKASGSIDDAGGMEYLHGITQNTPGIVGIRSQANLIIERAKKRSLMQAAAAILQEASGPQSAEELAATCETAVSEAMDRAGGDPVHIHEAMTEAVMYVDERQVGHRGELTGFKEFDDLTAGLEPGQLVVFAARPSVGKTIFGVNVADAVSGAGRSVLFFSLEMPRREIALRLMSYRAQVNLHALRAGRLSDIEREQIAMVRENAPDQRLFIDDKQAVNVAYVRAKAKRIKRKYGLHLLVIDYLGLMTGKGENRTQEIGSISRGLKSLAKELAIPIVVLAQLNRGVEARGDKRPLLSDLRDSGEIEQDADIIGMLHREALHSAGDDWADIAELIVRKNRNGPLGHVVLEFDGAHMAFRNTTRGLPYSAPTPRRGLS